MKPAAIAFLVLTWLGVGCSRNTSQSPTAPSATSASTSNTSFFSGTLAPHGSSFYSFTLTQAGTVSVTLAILTFGPRNPAPATIVGLGFGTPAGTDCSLTTSLNTGAGLVAQINSGSSMGTFCVEIFDVGKLDRPVDFVIRIVHP
jgi:hypothetical protein